MHDALRYCWSLKLEKVKEVRAASLSWYSGNHNGEKVHREEAKSKANGALRDERE